MSGAKKKKKKKKNSFYLITYEKILGKKVAATFLQLGAHDLSAGAFEKLFGFETKIKKRSAAKLQRKKKRTVRVKSSIRTPR